MDILNRNLCVTPAHKWKKCDKKMLIHVKQHLSKGRRDIQPPQTPITITALVSITDKFAAGDCQVPGEEYLRVAVAKPRKRTSLGPGQPETFHQIIIQRQGASFPSTRLGEVPNETAVP